MKPGKLIEAIELFFNEIIGTLLPGVVFVYYFSEYILEPIVSLFSNLIAPSSTFEWFLFLAISYIAGHAIIGLGQIAVKLCFDQLLRPLRKESQGCC